VYVGIPGPVGRLGRPRRIRVEGQSGHARHADALVRRHRLTVGAGRGP
jgi:hypothetical protein